MLKYNLLLFGLLLLVGCNWNEDYFHKSYELNVEYDANMGDVMLFIDDGIYNNPHEIILRGTRQEIIYNGINENTLNLIYREYYYKNGSRFIKDGFTQNLTYNITDDNEIVFKSFSINVIEANNKFIRFLIKSD